MSSRTAEQFRRLVNQHGSVIRVHLDGSTVVCPCVTAQGSRDPQWHLFNPDAPVCNVNGMLPNEDTVEIVMKGWVQPIQSGAVRRLNSEALLQMFGEIRSDDQLGILPCSHNGTVFNFNEWLGGTENWIEFRGVKFVVVAANLISVPDTGDDHHWELGLRRLDEV